MECPLGVEIDHVSVLGDIFGFSLADDQHFYLLPALDA